MPEITDLDLMAYADGELAGPRLEQIAQAVEASPGLRDRLRVFAETRGIEVFDAPLGEKVPAGMERLVRGWGRERPLGLLQPAAPSRPAGAGLAGWPAWLWPASGLGLGHAVAAAALLALGAAGGWAGAWLANGAAAGAGDRQVVASIGRGGMLAGGRLVGALDGASSRPESSGQAGEDEIVVLRSFKSRHAEYCRVFEIGHEGTGLTAGVACHGDAGWRIDVQARQVRKGAATPAGVGAVKEYVARVIEGDFLTGDEEASALRSGWRTTSP